MTGKAKVSIEGMHCDHCEVTVGAALKRAGLDQVRVDWRRGEASGTPPPPSRQREPSKK